MGKVLLLALLGASNPVLLAAVTVMLSLSSPKRLMLGYVLGGFAVSVPLGVVFVFWAEGRHSVHSTQQQVSPAINLALGAAALLIACAIAFRLDERVRRRSRRRPRGEAKNEGPPRWQKALDRGSARLSFVVGALLTLPGGRYLAALEELAGLGYGTAATVAVVVVVNLILLLLVELPLLSYVLAEDWTPVAVERFRAWIGRNGRRIALGVALVVGAALIARGLAAAA
jgi:Sap, sulfolipid-1-addressing protein